jgi:hypothetical protein
MPSFGEEIIQTLEEQGWDVGKPCILEVIFSFDDDTHAEDAMDMLNHQGFDAFFPEPTVTGEWKTKGVVELVPSLSVSLMNQWRENFSWLEERLDGKFEGWSACPN